MGKGKAHFGEKKNKEILQLILSHFIPLPIWNFRERPSWLIACDEAATWIPVSSELKFQCILARKIP